MSYARFGWDGSDFYIILKTQGYLDCCGCWLQETEWVEDPRRSLIKGYLKPVGEIIQTEFTTTADLVQHLNAHRDAGHHVPECAIEALLADAERNDAWIADKQATRPASS